MATNANRPSGSIKRVRRSTRSRDLEEPIGAAAEREVATKTFVAPAVPRTSRFLTFTPVRDVDVIMFLRQLIMLLEAGTPLLKALRTLGERLNRAGIRSLANDVADYVEAGNPLWQAFERHQQFDPVDINLVKASEASGTLVTIMTRIVQYKERRIMMKKRVRGALIYPTILVFVCSLVIFVLARFVVPEFQMLFEKLGVQVPTFTAWCFAFTDVLGNPFTWLIAIGVIVLLVVLYKIYVNASPVNRQTADRAKLYLPIAGPILRGLSIVELMRSLSLLLSSGLSMMVTLELVRNTVRNRAVANTLKNVRDSVERGEGIEAPLRRDAGIIPPMVTDMLVTGEETGSIDNIASQLAETYEEETAIRISSLSESLQPLLTVFLGGVVLIVALCLFVPMVGMVQNLSSGAMPGD